ncbi:hypothetical protein PQX77_003005 [Marasmius sp. AFHP31]|nr:hypothetical protein PQX77_003005 [Marasmius sp. AFHP31]
MDHLQYAFWRSGKHHSVLKVIIRTWRKRLEASQSLFALVGAGSRIFALHFDDPYGWDDWVWSSNTGAFDEVRYGEYVHHYLPPTTEFWEQLVQCMWDRLRGSFATSPKDQDAESVVSNPYGRFTDTRFNTITIDEPTLLAGGGHFIVVESDRSIVDCIYLYQRIFVPTLLPRHSGACSALCIALALDTPLGRTFSDNFTTSQPINA